MALGCTAGKLAAATISFSSAPIPGGYRLTATEEVSTYFVLQTSGDLGAFAPIAMEMGTGGAVWEVPDTSMRQFWNVRQVSVFAPEDSDGDYIDDIYEINHPFLNPLNAADALRIVPGGGISYLQEYRTLYGTGNKPSAVQSSGVPVFSYNQQRIEP